jgi:hypothetical protein
VLAAGVGGANVQASGVVNNPATNQNENLFNSGVYRIYCGLCGTGHEPIVHMLPPEQVRM